MHHIFTAQANNEQATDTTITACIFTTAIPGEMKQMDLVEQKGPIYNFVLSGIDVFTKYLFAVPLTNCSADTVVRELVKIFFQHSYLPSTLVSALGTNFTSKLMAELTKLLEVKLDLAALKQPETIGVVEGSHAALK